MGENTTRRRCGRAKQFFEAAQRKGLIRSNPFADLVANLQTNHERFYMVDQDVAQRVLHSCPDAQWRLLFALARFGGLRVPSEPLALTWGHINWAENKISVPSPQTEHHPGGASRTIPLFPELRPYLQAAWDEAPEGTEHVITRYRDTRTNLRTHLMRIVTQAGSKPWPKPWRNLRSTRQTELAETWPIQVVCAWIGNSQPVATKSYLQVTAEHFDRATSEAAQKAAHFQAHAEPSTGPHPNLPIAENVEKNAYFASMALVEKGPKLPSKDSNLN